MRLSDWLKNGKISYDLLGESCGFARETGRRYALGRRIPRKGHGQRIYLFTGGAVTPNDFYDLPQLPERAAAAAE